jgi:hypothetical protein
MNQNLLVCIYDENMLNLYAKELRKTWNYTEPIKQSFWKCMKQLQMPIDLIVEIEKNVIQLNEGSWWWIPFQPQEDIFQWDFHGFSFQNTPLQITIQPPQTGIAYFVHYHKYQVANGIIYPIS